MKKSLLVAPLLVLHLAAGASPATADSDANRCGAYKVKAASKYARSVSGCQSKAVRNGETVDGNCLVKAAGKLAGAFDKAEAADGCATVDDDAAVQADLDAVLSTIDALLAPEASLGALKCAGNKIKSAGRDIAGRLNCYARTARRDQGPSDSCFVQTANRVAAGFAKAERTGECTISDDLSTIAALDAEAADNAVRLLSPVCGDGLQGPGQQCEGSDDDACPTFCSDLCVCDFPPVCGDGVAELPEECDDGATVDGDGCSADCQLEDASALCTGVPAASGTAIDAVLISDEFAAPTFLAAPPLDATRLFVVERAGIVRILNLEDNSVNATPFIDVSDLTTTGGERGLFSMAFDPAYEENGRFYLSYTNTSGDLVLARYEVAQADPNVADMSTAQELLVVGHPGTSHHNGGQVQFSPDGYIYWSMGDSGDGGNAQDPDSMLGSILRADVAHDTPPYVTVPPTNPNYVDGSTELEYVWAKGLRNPWRFSFDRAEGDLYIADVGAGDREEIDYAPASSPGGENYGWNVFEGTTCNKASCPDPPSGFIMPIHEYPHSQGCAVMGGYVYRGCSIPDLDGRYFFSDLCSTFVQSFAVVAGVATDLIDHTDDARSTGASFMGVISWGQDARGELYIITGNNRVYRIEPE